MTPTTKIKNPYVGVFIFSSTSGKKPTLDKIIEATCEVMNLTFNQLCEPVRKKKIVMGRAIVWYLATVVYNLKISLAELGNAFGSFDHTTVIHNRESLRNQYHQDEDVRQVVNKIKSLIPYNAS